MDEPVPFGEYHPLYPKAVALEASIDVIRKAQGKPTRAEIHAMGVGTTAYSEATEDFLRDMLQAMGSGRAARKAGGGTGAQRPG